MSTKTSLGREPSLLLQTLILAGVALVGIGGMANSLAAQDYTGIRESRFPLVLKSQGSFFVDGDSVARTAVETGTTDGNIVINQMYVEFMKPMGSQKVPVVMLHGGTLTGANYQTTPDGRPGWQEFFVRAGYPSFIADQVLRGRSGFDQSAINDVRAGVAAPSTLPRWIRCTEACWTTFRFGPSFGKAWPDEQFPTQVWGEFVKQNVPDINPPSAPNPNFKALSDLSKKINGAVLIAHSEAGSYPLRAAALNADGIKGMVVMEPANGCSTTGFSSDLPFTDQQIATLAKIPTLVVFADHIDPVFWQSRFDDCQAFVKRLKTAGGNAQFLSLPAIGIKGNSHMLMQDKNSDQVASLIAKWIDKNVKYNWRNYADNH